MGRQKKSNKIPAWFNIHRYTALSKFNAAQWAIVLFSRLQAKRWLELERQGDLEATTQLDIHFEQMRQDPLLNLDRGAYAFLVAPDRITGKTFEAIQPLMVGDAVRLLEEWRQKNSKSVKAIDDLALVLRGEKKASFSAADFDVFAKEVAPQHNIVRVNLLLRNDSISVAFNHWLAATGSLAAPNSRENRDGRLARWASTGVVPYVDLIQWGYRHRIKPTRAEIAARFNGIFLKHTTNGEQTVGRTLATEAKLWLSEAMQHKLAAEVAAF